MFPRIDMVRGLLVALVLFPAAAFAQEASDGVAPETGTKIQSTELVTAKNNMVVAAHPLASRAGLEMLDKGGNAVDAMVAVQLVLGLVEPQSSGLGGGAFLVYHDATSGLVTTFDGRETAPLTARPDQFIGADGEAMGFFDAVVGGLSVGTPGTVSLLETTHRKYGLLPWKDLFEPAIKLAESGFEVSPRLNQSITGSAESLFRFEPAARYFFSEEGVPIFAGTRIINQAYADTLKAIANGGAQAFYAGDIARDIVKTVRTAPDNPGQLSLIDLANYETKEREAVCFAYRIYDVCGMGPPSSGALTIGQILGMLEKHDLGALGAENPESWRLIGEASRLAFADRGKYMADVDFVKMPKGLLNQEYLAERATLIPPATAQGKVLPADAVQPGNPPTDHALLFAPDQSLELPSTSHFSIADRFGNVVSMTSTIENGFGSRLMTNGFLLNNELTDFSFAPDIGGVAVANRLEPGKRPRSSMAPTIVYRNGKPYMAIGSPGGSRIIGYVLKTLVGVLDWNLDIQQAINLPHLVNRFGTYDVEEGTSAENFAPALAEMGYEIRSTNLNSGLHGIMMLDEGFVGGVDPRREGKALGN